jgi:uncharacterized protein (TIGR03067 family)
MISLVLPVLLSMPVAANESRKPTERELQRAHEMLAGNWTILSIVDNGEKLGPELVRAKFAESGRIHIGTRTASLIAPGTHERRVSALRIDPSRRPAEIDVTTRFDEELKGIYKFDGDRLFLCLAKHEEDARPTAFEAADGSDHALLELEMAKTAAPRPDDSTPAASTTPAPERAKPHQTDAERRDEEIRQKLTGTWSYVDRKGTLTVVLRADGSFETTRVWSKTLKRMIDGDTTTTQGRWNYLRGVLDARILSSTDPRLLGHTFTGWIQSVSSDSLVLRNLFGELRTARKVL